MRRDFNRDTPRCTAYTVSVTKFMPVESLLRIVIRLRNNHKVYRILILTRTKCDFTCDALHWRY